MVDISLSMLMRQKPISAYFISILRWISIAGTCHYQYVNLEHECISNKKTKQNKKTRGNNTSWGGKMENEYHPYELYAHKIICILKLKLFLLAGTSGWV